MKTARYALLAIAFLTPAAWLGLLLSCVRFGAAVCTPVNLAAVPLAIGALVLLPIGLTYVERARRRARKGMWLSGGSGPGWGRLFERTVRVVWGSEEGADVIIAGEVRYTRRRWLVPVKNGQRVYVDRREFWLWLDEVEKLHRTLPAGESAIGERLWKPKLKEGKYLAYCAILDAVGATCYPTPSPTSRQYVPGLPWSRVEEYEKYQASEGY